MLYVLATCGGIVLVGLVLFLSDGYRRRKKDYRKDLEAVKGVPAAENIPAGGSKPLQVCCREIRTDCMAKGYPVDVEGMPGWEAEVEPGVRWLRVVKVSGGRLRLCLLTNFGSRPREATVRVFYPEEGDSAGLVVLRVSQCESGYYPSLSLSETFYVQPGDSVSVVSPVVVPDARCDEWFVKSLKTNGEGGWCEVEPSVGESIRGSGRLLIRTFPKPAHVDVRNALVTVGCGTYPFQTLQTVVVSQGIVFDYYIEYPAFDACWRKREVIEVPPAGVGRASECRYMVYVRSNLPWKLEAACVDWVRADEPVMEKEERYNGRFAVTVFPNDERTRVKGFCAARHAVLRLMTELGQVRDIRVYQGGYVTIRGRRWLDRNLLGAGRLTDNAVPCGLDLETEVADSRLYGALFQFGRRSPDWEYSPAVVENPWNLNTDEHPVRNGATDPSPEGWRVPSSLELASLLQARNSVPSCSDEGWVMLESDEGVPVFFPMAGYRYHINGYRMGVRSEAGYWSSCERTRIYADAVLVRHGRVWHFPRQLKKQGFSIRCIEDDAFS